MSRQFWSETLTWATSDGTAVANTSSETIAVPNVTIPANYMQDGRTIRITAFGELSTTGTPTMIFGFRWGGVAGTTLALSDAITTTSGSAKLMWRVQMYITTRTNGSSGTLFATGDVTVDLTTSTQTTQVFSVAGNDTPVAVTCDLTADTALSFTAKWSAADPANTLTCHNYYIEGMN